MGQMNALAALFMSSREAREEEREEILNDAYRFTAYAVQGNSVALTTPKGRIFAEKTTYQGTPIIWFDYYPADTFDRVRFWMNINSVQFISDKLREHPEKRVKMENLMLSFGGSQ